MNHAARPLTLDELPRLHAANPDPRVRALLWTGLCCGLRISEIIALDVRHVLSPHGELRTEIDLDASIIAKRGQSRSIPLNPILGAVLNTYFLSTGRIQPHLPLFETSRKPYTRLSRRQAMRIITTAFQRARLDGALPSHALRKTFAQAIHTALGNDLAKTQLALRHMNPASTVRYLQSAQVEVRQAIRHLYADTINPQLPHIEH